MKPYVVVEGESDAELVIRVLAMRHAPGRGVVSAGGQSSVIALAKSLLATRDSPVAILVDAETTDEQRVHEQGRIFYDFLRPYASQRPFRVFFAVPELEVVYFQVHLDWASEIGVPDAAMMIKEDEACSHPRQLLERLLSRAQVPDRRRFVSHLTDAAIGSIAEHSLFSELITFVRQPKKWRPTSPQSAI